VTLSDEFEEDAPQSDKFLAFVAPYVEEEDSYYSEHSENEVKLKEAYKSLYNEFEKLREGRKHQVNDLNSLHTEKNSLLLKIQKLEEKLLETQLQLERVTDEKLTHMLSIQKSPHDKTGLRYVVSSSDIISSSKTVFVPPTVLKLPPVIEEKQKEKVNDDVLGIQQPHSIKRPSICHHCRLSGHVRPQCSLLNAQKAKAKKKVPRQAHYGTMPAPQHQATWHQASHQAPWGQAPRDQFQAPWSYAPHHQPPLQRFVAANQNGTYKSKPKHLRRPQEQYIGEPPVWMQNMMEWMMQSCQPPPTRRQTWAEKDSYPRRGNRRT
jgi:hypothetical protein